MPLNFDQFSFNPNINAAIRMDGYCRPTPIQEQAIPLVLKGCDVLGPAQTGIRRTAAFVLPILQQLDENPSRLLRVLIIEPTRELAEQAHQSIVDLSRNSRARSATIYGGVSRTAQILNFQRGVVIFVACPGRHMDRSCNGKAVAGNFDSALPAESGGRVHCSNREEHTMATKRPSYLKRLKEQKRNAKALEKRDARRARRQAKSAPGHGKESIMPD